MSVSAQNQLVKGKVTDDKTKSTLIGVSVLVEGTTNGTITDFNGNFTISTSTSNPVLEFSYIGYNSQKIQVNGQTNLEVIMTEDTKNLDEVIVVGYGVQKKSLVTGAISGINSADLDKANISFAGAGLEGRTSGVQVVPVSGSPGAGIDIRIRGYGSNSGTNPLYVVDGIKVGDINYLDPSDIASMEVLKDAASCAIYGAEGGNGVVMITTKKGVSGKLVVNYDFQYGFTSAGNLPKLMNTAQYADFMTEKNVDGNSILTAPIDQDYNTNWLQAIFKNGYTTKHHINISGGDDKSTYSLGLSYYKDQGIVTGQNDFERYSTLFTGDHQLTK